MEQEIGKIINIINGKLIVQIESGDQCKLCGSAHACLTLTQTTRQIEIPHKNENVKIGDRVSIGFKPQTRLLSSVLVFLMPVIFLIVGYFVGNQLFQRENMAILFSFLGLVFSFLLLWLLNKFFIRSTNFDPMIEPIEN